ncbi:MAG: DUF1385 domain-containing protein [Clostridia bacterium]|nr:DUF1385 domain-containing protein [Clostridia bacterium]
MTEHKKICKARSNKNGIIFYSNVFPFCGTETFIDGNGNICNKPVVQPPDQIANSLAPLDDRTNALRKKRRMLLDTILIFLSFVLGFAFNIVGLPAAIMYFCLTTSSLFYAIVESCHKGGIRDENGYSFKRFHGTEHMAINAYNTLQRIPTLEEIRSFSRFRKDCGSRFTFKTLSINLLSTLLFAIQGYINTTFFLKLFLLIGSLMLIDIVISFISDRGWLRFLQVFITEKPSDKELLLAIEGLKNFEEMEAELEQIKPIVDSEVCDGIVIIGVSEDS